MRDLDKIYMATFLSKEIRLLSCFFQKRIKFFLLRSKKTIQNKKGFTLLEALVAFGILVFMVVFIGQMFRQSHRQAKKIKEDIRLISSLSNVLDLMRQDFQGLTYQLDINDNFKIQFPMEENEEFLERVNSFLQNQRGKDLKKTFPVLLSPHFIFEGKGNEIKFVSYSFSNSFSDDISFQWMKIHYYIGDCERIKPEEKGSCLIRSTSLYWDSRQKDEAQDTLILLKGFDSLKFSYATGEELSAKEWKDEYELQRSFLHRESGLTYPQQRPFPSVIKLEFQKEGRQNLFFFPVSVSYLRAWNPYDKAYVGFPEWIPPQRAKPPSDSNKNFRRDSKKDPSKKNHTEPNSDASPLKNSNPALND